MCVRNLFSVDDFHIGSGFPNPLQYRKEFPALQMLNLSGPKNSFSFLNL